MLRIVLGVFTCLLIPTNATSQYGGVPSGVRDLGRPTGTYCRTVQSVAEQRPDAACEATGRRAYEVRELECSHFKSGNLDAFYSKFENQAGDCVAKEPAG